MKRLVNAIVMLFALVSISSTGVTAHASTPSMESMHGQGHKITSSGCAAICNPGKLSSHNDEYLIEETNDDDDDILPPYVATSSDGTQSVAYEHTATARRLASLELPPLIAKPYILFAVFRL